MSADPDPPIEWSLVRIEEHLQRIADALERLANDEAPAQSED